MEDFRDPMHQSDASINFDEIDKDLQGLLDDSPNTTFPQYHIYTYHALNQISEKDAKSPEYTSSKPSDLKTITFNQSLLSSSSTSFKQLKRDSKSQSTLIDNRKKLKLKKTDNTLKNRNVIITRYVLQDQEQAHLLDLVIYDILAK
ncbi:hypothetical protein RclHR1_05350011 [Rhizophagus clarus]|uniref:Uncharacterized protein n=1 Tax=Rhizophagus clarus TaxID=94130 RepID=A0A2Z6SEP3_9GLOM|nr:hypothetical protein RclHR1_05350011 [Rhizophagus clarus]